MKIHPVYVDGPLEGQDLPADSGMPFVQALDYAADGVSLSMTWAADVVTYRLREFAFHAGGKAVSFWVGSCSPGEPDAETVFRALCKPELFGRAEVRDVPGLATS